MARIFSAAFHAALKHILEAEGGWSDHAKDPGGATMRGITLKVFREFHNNKALTKADLKRISMQDVYEIYHDRYWRNVRGDELPAALALMMFDAAVNSGVKNAGLALQRAIKSYSPIKLSPDGVIGPQTLAALGGLDVKRLVDEFAARRMHFYSLLRTFAFFGLGWSRRLMAAKRAADALLPIASFIIRKVT